MNLFLRRLGLFSLTLLILTVVFNNIFHISGDLRFDSRFAYLQSHTESYNTLFFGTSRTLRHVIPSKFDSLNRGFNVNTKSYNLGTPANKSLETYTQYQSFLNTYSKSGRNDIKYAFIEINPLDGVTAANSTTRKGYYWLSLENINFVNRYFNSTINKFSDKVAILKNYYIAFLLREFKINFNTQEKPDPDVGLFNGSLKDGYISLEDEIKYSHSESRKKELLAFENAFSMNEGSLLKRRKSAEQVFSYMAEYNRPVAVHVERLKQLIESSKGNNIELRFIIQPRLANYREVLALQNTLPKGSVINIASPKVYPEFWNIANSFDVGHLKKEGAVLATSALSQQFVNSIKPL